MSFGKLMLAAILIISMVLPLNVVLASGDDDPSIVTSVPREMSYQAILRDSAGDPVVDSVYDITFRIFDVSSGGTSLWDEILPCTTTAGVFNTMFSNVNLAFDVDYWLELEVGGEILDPRQKMGMVGYSAVSDTADYTQHVATVDGATGGTISGDVSIQSDLSVDGNIDATGKATIGPGHINSGTNAFVAGYYNTTSGLQSTVGGGAANTASGGHSTVAGGSVNTAGDSISFVGGGSSNSASSYGSTVGGGESNLANGMHSTVAGGYNNTASGYASAIGGGAENNVDGENGAIAGGYTNSVYGHYSGVFSGWSNSAGNVHEDTAAFVGGGFENSAEKGYSTVSGGSNNTAGGDYSTVGGGQSNSATAATAAIGGGNFNTASGNGSVVSGGYAGLASGENATIGGGWHNHSSGSVATIAGGQQDTASADYAVVGGGILNVASGNQSTVGGGWDNTASSICSVIPGGCHNVASGDYSMAVGSGARALHHGAFVWADATNDEFESTNDNQIMMLASGGTWIYSDPDLSSGVTIHPGASAWATYSDINAAENHKSINNDDILQKISSLAISEWNYRAQNDNITHVGPNSQDFYRAFGLGESDKTISTTDADGVALAGIQALLEKIDKLEARIAELEAEKK